MWNSDDYEIKAIVKHNNEPIEKVALNYAGKTSTYETEVEVTQPGTYELIVYGYDADTGNTGVDKTTFNIGD